MLEKYTYLRDELRDREALVVRASHYTIMQEEVVTELRGFIEDMINSDPEEERKKMSLRKYMGGKGAGKTSVDRMLSTDPLAKFDLFTSMVNENKTSDEALEEDFVQWL